MVVDEKSVFASVAFVFRVVVPFAASVQCGAITVQAHAQPTSRLHTRFDGYI